MDLSKLSIEYIDGHECRVEEDRRTQKDKILPYMTIVYPYKGYYQVSLGDDPLTLLPHGAGCYITAPGARHTIVHRLSPGETWMQPRWLRLSVVYDHALDVTGWFTPPLVVTGEQAQPLIAAIDELLTLRNREQTAFQKLRIAAQVLEQLMKICPISPVRPEMERIYPAIKLVKDQYQTRLCVEQMAQVCAMSPATFYRLFRQSVQNTPMGYLDAYRLKQAARLLLTGNEKLSVIAEQCGFCDEFHLSRNFKRYYGISPREYRRHTM